MDIIEICLYHTPKVNGKVFLCYLLILFTMCLIVLTRFSIDGLHSTVCYSTVFRRFFTKVSNFALEVF